MTKKKEGHFHIKLKPSFIEKIVSDKWVKKFIVTEDDLNEESSSDYDFTLKQNFDDMEFDTSKFTEVDLSREPLNVVFIGHVDSGKSTTCGRILVSCSDRIDKNTI